MGDEEVQQTESGTGPEQSAEYDFSGFTEQQTPSVAEDKDNPKWAPFLSELDSLPDLFKAPLTEKIKGHLKEWDKGINDRFQQINKEYEPYKPFREQNIDPNRLNAAWQVAQQISQDPVTFFNNLQNALIKRGMLQQQQQQQEQQKLNDTPPDPDDPYYKELQDLRARQEQVVKYMQQQQYEAQQQQAVAEESAKIDQGFAAVETRLGRPLTGELKQLIIEKAMALSQAGQQYVTIEQAATEVFKTIATLRGGKPAPPVISTSGGSVPQYQGKRQGDMSREERLAQARAIKANLDAQ